MPRKSRISVIIDTETSGLPSNRWSDPVKKPEDYESCRLVQLAWIVVRDGETLLEKSYFVKPEGFVMSEGASAINGITTERATLDGISFDLVLNEFVNDMKNLGVTHLVAHNLNFDKSVLLSEFARRAGHSDNIDIVKNLKEVCTMECGREYAKIPLPSNHAKYKAPKLTELYSSLFGRVMREKHDALYDTQKCAECYNKMREMVRNKNVANN
tara:strand:- start:16417 stop:17055 length:639 start_codon:yes stop_codon:yes gene_type:complete